MRSIPSKTLWTSVKKGLKISRSANLACKIRTGEAGIISNFLAGIMVNFWRELLPTFGGNYCQLLAGIIANFWRELLPTFGGTYCHLLAGKCWKPARRFHPWAVCSEVWRHCCTPVRPMGYTNIAYWKVNERRYKINIFLLGFRPFANIVWR